MAEGFQLSVLTGDGTIFADRVDYVNLPTDYGSVGILAGHAPMLCAVGKGILRCTQAGATLRIPVSGGIADVGGSEVTVLVSDGKMEN